MTIQPTRRIQAILARVEDLQINMRPGKAKDYVSDAKDLLLKAFYAADREAGR